MSDTKETIRQAEDTKKKRITVDEWGVDIEVRTMDVPGRIDMMNSFRGVDGEPDENAFFPALLIACCYDTDTGERIFEPGDEPLINSKNGTVVDRIANICMDMNGMSKEVETELGKDS